jgi:outer membrane protein TolC
MTMRQTTARHHRPSFRLSPLWLCGLLTLGTAGLPFRAAHALDLRQSYEAAIGADPRLAAARATAAAAEERLPQAWSQLLPNVSFSANEAQNLLDTTRPNPLTGENVQVHRSLRQHQRHAESSADDFRLPQT